MDKNKSAEEIQTHIIAGYNGEWVKLEDHQKAMATLQKEVDKWRDSANYYKDTYPVVISELQESISIVRAEYQRSETLFTLRIEELEKQKAELVKALIDAEIDQNARTNSLSVRIMMEKDNGLKEIMHEEQQRVEKRLKHTRFLIQSNENRVV